MTTMINHEDSHTEVEIALFLSLFALNHVTASNKFTPYYRPWRRTRKILAEDRAALLPVVTQPTAWARSLPNEFADVNERLEYSAFVLMHGFALVTKAARGVLPATKELDHVSVEVAVEAVVSTFRVQERSIARWKAWLSGDRARTR